MISLIRKPYGWAKLFSVILTAAFAFALLDAFVIPKTYAAPESPEAESPPPETEAEEEPAAQAPETTKSTEEPPAQNTDAAEPTEEPVYAEPVITANSYSDENIQITIETVEKYNTTFYVADIRLSDPEYLKTALAYNSYGRNLKESTSEMAAAHNAIFAINGDYYGFRDTGYVLRNGVLYRDDAGSEDALIIGRDGVLSTVGQDTVTGEMIADAWQIFSFGPTLVSDGVVVVDEASEVSRSRSSNPRTAIGQIGDGHYIAIVSDGRTGDSQGLSLLQLAQEFAQRGAVTAYNLDGGGSSTMVFCGTVINTPTSGRSVGEREVSDIVYIGYE